ncbi:phage baseplate assembly protein domain-containing protein [Methylobacterium sp. A54F]
MSRTHLFRAELKETNDDGDLQTGSGYGYAGEELDKVHVVRQHGLASHAPKGSHGIGLAGSGERSLVAFLGLEHQDKRPKKLKEGQTVLYDAAGNATRMLGEDGVWHDAADRPQKMTGKTIAITGQDKVTITVGGTTVTVRAGRVDLGGEGGSAVMTQAGPSSVVFAKV